MCKASLTMMLMFTHSKRCLEFTGFSWFQFIMFIDTHFILRSTWMGSDAENCGGLNSSPKQVSSACLVILCLYMYGDVFRFGNDTTLYAVLRNIRLSFVEY